MICMETVSKVRRWVKADGMSIKEVARRTGLSRNTVRKYLRDENAVPAYRMSKERSSRRLLEHEVHLRGMMREIWPSLRVNGAVCRVFMRLWFVRVTTAHTIRFAGTLCA